MEIERSQVDSKDKIYTPQEQKVDLQVTGSRKCQ